MMTKGLIGRLLGVEEISAKTAPEQLSQLRDPTLDERVSLYLRAVHGKQDFGSEVYSDARNRLLNAMAADIAVKLGFNLPENSSLPLDADADENEVVPAPLIHSLASAETLDVAGALCAPSYEFEDGSRRPATFIVRRSPTSLKFTLRTMGGLGIVICATAIIVGVGTFALFRNNNSDWLTSIDTLQKATKYEVASDSPRKTASQTPAQVEVPTVASGSPTLQTALPSQAGPQAIAPGSPSPQLSSEELAELARRVELLGTNTANTVSRMPSQARSQAVASGPPSPQVTASAIVSGSTSRQLSLEGTAAQLGVCAIVAKPADFDHQTVSLQGTATALKETTSRRGNDYTTFNLNDASGCGAVKVFTWGHAAMSNGDQVRVEGVFEAVHRVRQYTFHNEVEATKVTPGPR
jgi:hypothetical protein